jgi:hypothetical protein
MILTGSLSFEYNSILRDVCKDLFVSHLNGKIHAGVVKLVDALDSKSSGTRFRVGSIPTSGTTKES